MQTTSSSGGEGSGGGAVKSNGEMVARALVRVEVVEDVKY